MFVASYAPVSHNRPYGSFVTLEPNPAHGFAFRFSWSGFHVNQDLSCASASFVGETRGQGEELVP